MSMFQDNFSISYKGKFLGRESEYCAKTVVNLDDKERIVAQTKESVTLKPKLVLTGDIYRKMHLLIMFLNLYFVLKCDNMLLQGLNRLSICEMLLFLIDETSLKQHHVFG